MRLDRLLNRVSTVASGLVIAAAVCAAPAKAVDGPYNFPNSSIADHAEAIPNGTWEGQCLVFAEKMIAAAGGPSMAFGLDTSTYQTQWSQHAVAVASLTEAQRGDIIQWGGGAGGSELHTAIVTSPGADPGLIDSNWGYDESVHRGDFASRNQSGAYRIWRVGRSRAADDPVGSLDSAASPAPGQVRIGGWSFDANAQTAAVTIHAYVGGPAGQPGAEGHALGPASGYRPDVNRVFAGVGDYHGFDFTFDTGVVGQVPVCVYAINIGAGSNQLLACKTITIANPNPLGSLDSAASPAPGQVRIGGWSFDPNAQTAAVTIHAYVGGPAGQPGAEGHALAPASGYRPDVNRVFAGVGDYHGFDFMFDTGVVGQVPVCVYAINIGAGSNQLLACKTITIAKLEVPVNTSLPALVGTPLEGQTLSESHGSWSNRASSYKYTWERCDSASTACNAIGGASDLTYTLTAADIAHTIRIQETASNATGPGAPATSAATPVIRPRTLTTEPPHRNTSTPTGTHSLTGPPACSTPNVKHLTLTQAKRRLLRSHCSLGRVYQARRHHRHLLRVAWQSAPPHSHHATNYPINIKLR